MTKHEFRRAFLATTVMFGCLCGAAHADDKSAPPEADKGKEKAPAAATISVEGPTAITLVRPALGDAAWMPGEWLNIPMRLRFPDKGPVTTLNFDVYLKTEQGALPAGQRLPKVIHDCAADDPDATKALDAAGLCSFTLQLPARLARGVHEASVVMFDREGSKKTQTVQVKVSEHWAWAALTAMGGALAGAFLAAWRDDAGEKRLSAMQRSATLREIAAGAAGRLENQAWRALRQLIETFKEERLWREQQWQNGFAGDAAKQDLDAAEATLRLLIDATHAVLREGADLAVAAVNTAYRDMITAFAAGKDPDRTLKIKALNDAIDVASADAGSGPVLMDFKADLPANAPAEPQVKIDIGAPPGLSAADYARRLGGNRAIVNLLALGVAAAGGLTYWSQVDAWGTMTQVFALFGIAFALPGGLAAYATPAKG